MPYKFFTNSHTAWRAMFEEMSRARASIYLEMYIFVDDIEDFNFLKLLKAKASEGIEVRIILDSFGSSDLSKSSVSELKDAGAEVIFVSNFLHHTHRKILVVDDKVAFIGGVNFKQTMNKWRDLMVRVHGRLAKSVSRSFAKAYAISGGKDEALVALSRKVASYKAKTWLIEHFPISNKFYLKKIYKEAFRNAETGVLLITPYFIPKHWLVKAMKACAHKGKKVEVMIPKATDNFFVDRVNYFYIYKISKLGVDFYIEPDMNHAKLLLVDGKEGMIGSNNLDRFSFEFNSEIGVFIKDPEAIRKLLTIVNGWKARSSPFNPKSYKPKWFDYIFSPIIRLLFFL